MLCYVMLYYFTVKSRQVDLFILIDDFRLIDWIELDG